MPASGISDSGQVTPSSCIGTLTCQLMTSSNVWFAHIAINGQDFWQSCDGLSSGQHGMPSAIAVDEGIGFADISDAWASGPAIRPARAPISKSAERMDRSFTR